MQQARAVLKKARVDEDDPKFQELKSMLETDNRLGYIGRFTKWLFMDRETLEHIRVAYEQLKNHVGRIPPIDTFKTLEDLTDFLNTAEISRKSKRVLNALPGHLRRFISDKLINLLELNSEFLDEVKEFFEKKAVTVKTLEGLYKITKDYIKKLKTFSLKAIRNKIKRENLNVNEIIGTKRGMLMEILNYEASHALGSPHWCISYPPPAGPEHWKRDVGLFGNQFFIYDFTKSIDDDLCMIGVTIDPDGEVLYAHARNDDRVSPECKKFEILTLEIF